MTIIKAGTEDLSAAAELFDLYRQFYEQPPDIEGARKFLSGRIDNNESVIFLAIDEFKNKAMGFVQLYPAFSSVNMQRIWILNDLFVHENYRNQGVAESLIIKSKTHAIATNAKGIILETHVTNDIAQKLYDKIGFEKDEEHFYYNLVIE